MPHRNSNSARARTRDQRKGKGKPQGQGQVSGEGLVQGVGTVEHKTPFEAKQEEVSKLAEELQKRQQKYWEKLHIYQSTSPMDRDFAKAVDELLRATQLYVAAAEAFGKRCENC